MSLSERNIRAKTLYVNLIIQFTVCRSIKINSFFSTENRQSVGVPRAVEAIGKHKLEWYFAKHQILCHNTSHVYREILESIPLKSRKKCDVITLLTKNNLKYFRLRYHARTRFMSFALSLLKKKRQWDIEYYNFLPNNHNRYPALDIV